MDIVGSNGLVLLNNGNGTFTPGSSAFAPEIGTSDLGPNLAAGDLNNDGKVDLAVGNGAAVHVYLGNGDGTFTAGNSYTSINDVGYLTATDLDGDGNTDLYVGVANGGFFGGDQAGASQAYALMGNGDGSFKGAPLLPFIYTGNNLAALTSNHILDAVGVNSNASFTSYLGDGMGGFSPAATLSTSPITINGAPYTVANIDTYAIGDINGDGIPDLAYIGIGTDGFNGPGDVPGVFVALGTGQGGFASPTFYSVPSTLAAGNIDINWTISNLHLADVNNDGKADLIYNYSDTTSLTSTIYFGTVVQLSNGNGTFQTPQVIPYRSAAYSSVSNPTETSYVSLITDLNNDGKLDLIFIAQSTTIDFTLSTYVSTIQVALGNGNGTFSSPTTVAGPGIMVQSFTDQVPASIEVGDMNGDGIPDLIALGASTSTYDAQVAVSLGNGDGTFKAPILTTYSAQYLNNSQGLAVADFNGDGKLDVALTDPYDPTGSGISLGNGDGTLQTVGGSSETLPNLSINLQVGGATGAFKLNGGLPSLISGNVELLSQASSGGSSPNFSLSASSASGTVTPGQSAQTTLTLTPSNGFDQSVSLTCSGLPTGAACSFSSASVTVDGSPTNSTLTITTTAPTAMNSSAPPVNPLIPGAVLLAGIGLPMAWRRRREIVRLSYGALPVLLLISALTLQACGGGGGSSSTSGSGSSGSGSSSSSSSGSSSSSSSGGSTSSSSSGRSSSSSGSSSGGGATGTPAGHYTVTITATGGSTTQTTTYTLTVN